MNANDIRDFRAYLKACTDAQVRGVYEKEKAAYEPSEQDLIRENAKEYAPSGPIFRIAGLPKQSRYVGLLFRSHPNEPDPTAEDAAFIVRACNCFEELLAAAKAGLHWADCADMATADPLAREHIEKIRAAIAKAEAA